MNLNDKLVIISNEKISQDQSGFYCDNIDMKSIPEGLDQNLNSLLIGRKSNIQRSHKINIEKIKTSSNAFSFLFEIFKTLKDKKINYLIVSITPYTFFAYLLLFIYRKKIYVYLRSNGYEEYKIIFGYIGPPIYHFMYIILTFGSHIIVCEEKLARKKRGDLVYPSELDNHWLKNTTRPLLDKPRLLYVGRIKVEKGIFSLVEILKKMTFDFELSIVGKPESLKLRHKKINYLGYKNEENSLREIYDEHNIFILPSFTEAHPKALYESLARERPVILFEEIGHVTQDKQGIFITKRNVESLTKTISFIMDNYTTIQNSMKKNILPTKQNFISQMTKILTGN